MVGSMVPSSRFLSRKMLDDLNLDKAECIVELGPGTGVITDIIIDKMGPETKLLIIELNPTFYKNLQKRVKDNRITIKQGSATDIGTFLREADLPKADYIISSLPLAALQSMIRKRIILQSKNQLKDNGQFIQYQYTLQSLQLLKKAFEKVVVRHCILNVPPAFVYKCQLK